ncbi:MAG TPA: class I SAM-dependent methyltransferase [Nocardioidaceae bacterium]|nr:class I SAM-dependent methyltransferase [Nocardioidaceae bacterium]
MEVATLEQLLTPEGRALVDTATTLLATGDELAVGSRLRADYPADLVAAAIGQVLLRRRAEAKFGADAVRLWFTTPALEQASRRRVADHRADRLRSLRVRTVLDLGCGIGADLLAYARAGLEVTGVDLDPLRAAMAQANLAALGLTGLVETADARTYDTAGFDAVYVDPARRDDRGRVFDPRAQSPPWDVVAGLLRGRAVAKAAPGIPHRLVPDGVEAEFVSDAGDLVEAALWGEDFASTGRRATVLPGGGSLTTDDLPTTVPLGPPADWWYEPDSAVIRAGLVGAVAAQVGGHLLDRRIAYVTSTQRVATPFARGYRLVEEVPFREKRLRAALRARGIGTLAIKKRGVDVVPEQLRPRLDLRGDASGTLILTRVRDAARAFLVEPM